MELLGKGLRQCQKRQTVQARTHKWKDWQGARRGVLEAGVARHIKDVRWRGTPPLPLLLSLCRGLVGRT